MDVGISDDDEKTEDEGVKKESTPAPAAESRDERPLKSRNSIKLQDSEGLAQRPGSRKAKRSADLAGRQNGRSSQTPQPAKRPRLSAKAVCPTTVLPLCLTTSLWLRNLPAVLTCFSD